MYSFCAKLKSTTAKIPALHVYYVYWMCVANGHKLFLKLTISILEDDAHHISLSPGVLVHQPERLHLWVHKPALICTARPNTLIINTWSLQRCQNLSTKCTWELRWCLFLQNTMLFFSSLPWWHFTYWVVYLCINVFCPLWVTVRNFVQLKTN